MTETTDRRAAMQGTHVIYAKSWASAKHYGDKTTEDKIQARATRLVHVTNHGSKMPSRTAASCTACLCVGAWSSAIDILDGPRSVVIPEARNRMLAQMAVLHRMLAKS